MAYRIKQSESLEKAVRRIGADQIVRAIPQLGGGTVPPENIHEVRKTTKRLKALLRAVRPALPKKTFRARYDAICEVADLLSTARDQFILAETIGKLERDAGADSSAAFARLHAIVGDPVLEPSVEPDPATVAKATRLLLKEEKRFAKIKIPKRSMTQFFDGVEHVYGRGRRELRRAYRSPDEEVFHDLRKAVQWHWRHMALIWRCWPEYFTLRIATGRELAQILGDEHDLSFLRSVVAAHAAKLGDDGIAIDAIAANRQEMLRTVAQWRAERFFAEKPREFRNRMEAYWRAGKKIENFPLSTPETACSGSAPPLLEQPLSSAPRLVVKSPRLPPSQGAA